MRRIGTALSWAAALYVLLRVGAFYLDIGSTRRHHIESAAFVFVALLLLLVFTRARPADLGPDKTLNGGTPGPTLVVILFMAASVALYWPLLWTGFFADDYVILDAVREGRLTVWRELFRPMIFVMWRPFAAITESPAVSLHALNVILHGINASLVSVLAHRLLRRRRSALVAGALFLCMPATVEAVAWPSGLQDVLMTTFVLTFLALAMSDREAWWIDALAVLALIAGLLTKETAIAAPLLAAIGAACLASPHARRRAWRIAALSLVAVAAFVAVRLTFLPLPVSYGADLTRYGIKELLVRPFATLVVPLREEETRRAPAAAIGLVSLVVVASRLAAGRWSRTDHTFRVTVAGTVMILAAVAPVLSYFFIDPDLLGSRYLYLAQVGWALVLIAIIETAALRHRTASLGLLILLMGGSIVAARMHARLWVDAALTRDRLLVAAGSMGADCSSWVFSGVPSTIRGVPVFINGFPEAMHEMLPGRIRMAPATFVAGECRVTWNGARFVRD